MTKLLNTLIEESQQLWKLRVQPFFLKKSLLGGESTCVHPPPPNATCPPTESDLCDWVMKSYFPFFKFYRNPCNPTITLLTSPTFRCTTNMSSSLILRHIFQSYEKMAGSATAATHKLATECKHASSQQLELHSHEFFLITSIYFAAVAVQHKKTAHKICGSKIHTRHCGQKPVFDWEEHDDNYHSLAKIYYQRVLGRPSS